MNLITRLDQVWLGCVLLSLVVAGSAQAASGGAVAEEKLESLQLVLEPLVRFERAALTVEGPEGYVAQQAFGPEETVRFALIDGEGGTLPDGRYRYRLHLTADRSRSGEIQQGLFFVREGSGVSRTDRRDQLAAIRESLNREEKRRVQAQQQAAMVARDKVGEIVTPPDSYALSIDGDFALEGNVFKEGRPFIHNDGGYTYGNTALGLNALVNATPEFGPYNDYGSFNTATGLEALYSNTWGFENTAIGERALRNNTGGLRNAASGVFALYSNTVGLGNTASGYATLYSNIDGYLNTAIGYEAMRSNTTGARNSATGLFAMYFNTSGDNNTACGSRGLQRNTTGSYNTASGYYALGFNTTGYRNTAVGFKAGFNATTGSDNIFIGHGAAGVAGEGNTIRIGGTTVGTGSGEQNRTFINGIRGTVTGQMDAITVMVDSDGQLGTASSSRRVKKQVADMGHASNGVLSLRPVTFKYKQEPVEGEQPVRFGLIAEEVAEVLPDLVVYDEDGQPDAVRYHLLSSLLLNELQKQHRVNQEQGEELKLLRERLARLEAQSSP